MEIQRTRIVKTTLKKNKVGELTLTNFTIYYKAIIINTVSYRYKDSHINQQKKIESPEIDPNIHEQLIFFLQWCKGNSVEK